MSWKNGRRKRQQKDREKKVTWQHQKRQTENRYERK